MNNNYCIVHDEYRYRSSIPCGADIWIQNCSDKTGWHWEARGIYMCVQTEYNSYSGLIGLCNVKNWIGA